MNSKVIKIYNKKKSVRPTHQSGSYDEEYLLPLHFNPAARRVLFLGLGLGTGVGVLSKAKSELVFTCVEKNIECVRFFKQNIEVLPERVEFKTFVDAPLTFLKKSTTNKRVPYDIIWIDLNSNKGGVEDLYNLDFWHYVLNLTDKKSIVACHLTGVPSHLLYYFSCERRKDSYGPFQQIIKNALIFPFFKLIPHGDLSTTLLLSRSPLVFSGSLEDEKISVEARLQKLRCQYMLKYELPIKTFQGADPTPKMTKMSDCIEGLNQKYLEESLFGSTNHLTEKSLRSFIYDRSNWNLVGIDMPFTLAASVIISSDHIRGDFLDGSDWADNIFENFDFLKSLVGPALFYNFLIPNAWSILTHQKIEVYPLASYANKILNQAY